jgi:hypothetical protein
VVYFGFNAYIVIVPLIPPYINGNGTKQEVKGWVYIVVVIIVISVAVVYYYAVFGLTTDAQGGLHKERTVLRLTNSYPILLQEPEHDPNYGVRRKVEIVHDSNVGLYMLYVPSPLSNVKQSSSYLYWLFGGSDKDYYPDSSLVHIWNHLMGR